MKATTVEQGKRLVELGIDKYTADLCWVSFYDENHMMSDYRLELIPYMFFSGLGMPAWSLSALLELIAREGVLVTLRNSPFDCEWRISYDIDDKWEQFHAENPIDAAIKMIENLVRKEAEK